jgi:anaerobic selenocysteine-containing dehydrogenase
VSLDAGEAQGWNVVRQDRENEANDPTVGQDEIGGVDAAHTEHPHDYGRLCPRCLTVPGVVYHPDRLKYPMKRVGERGQGKGERTASDEGRHGACRGG